MTAGRMRPRPLSLISAVPPHEDLFQRIYLVPLRPPLGSLDDRPDVLLKALVFVSVRKSAYQARANNPFGSNLPDCSCFVSLLGLLTINTYGAIRRPVAVPSVYESLLVIHVPDTDVL